ncbi:alpha-amylase family protein [Herbidospora mongoliensis]|uniref:alpha-amylase family protein n=1 Tax=Herbidospora mongoliensis TaxID=688067 RepID=UPI00082CFFF7|nr:alpha-amylase family protein [Herbidospora mongoliensis]
MRLTQTSELWWKNAIVYCLDIETFADGNGDGIGDFRGAIQHIDHLDRMGVTCIWLMPFFPTPDRDDGYDIVDFYSVDPRLGTLGDFVEFMRVARDRGIRVIADLVVNHTSDQHPWFKDARSSKKSKHRDWYIWSDKPEPDDPKGVVFPDQENSLWQLDKKTGQYYFHRFYKFQPDLNTSNPEVRDEIARILGFWMELGLSGFRVDAVPFLVERVLEKDDSFPDPHLFFADLRAFMNRRDGTAMLLGEVNLPYKDLMAYFGDTPLGNEITMCFDFIGMQRMYLSLAREDATPLAQALRERPLPPKDSQWASFVRNHDELTLDKLTKKEREEVFAAFAPDEDMRIFDRGIRRRLPPMLDGDPRRIRMVYSLLFALPGTPVMFYGEEIGMGENLAIEGRLSVRTPMQWTAGKHAGFSDVEPAIPVTGGAFGPSEVNVSAQRRDPESLLSWIGRLVEQYREAPELAWGSYEVLDGGDDSVLVLRNEGIVTLHNFAGRTTKVTLDLDEDGKVLADLFSDDVVEIKGGEAEIDVDDYGCRWFRLSDPETAP